MKTPKTKNRKRESKEKLFRPSLLMLHSYDSKRFHVKEREAILRAVLDSNHYTYLQYR
jgi:hypothetical protein